MAVKMGYHRDGENFRFKPLEIEMRRRIWWHIVRQDWKLAMINGCSQRHLPFLWNTKLPLNIDDDDLQPDQVKPFRARGGPTEMAFVLLLNQAHQFRLATEDSSEVRNFEDTILNTASEQDVNHRIRLASLQSNTERLYATMRQVEEKYIDEHAGSAHIAALAIQPLLTYRRSETLVSMDEHPEWGSEVHGPDDVMFKLLLQTIERRVEAGQSLARFGFDWYLQLHIDREVLPIVVSRMSRYLLGAMAERVWNVLEKTYSQNIELTDLTQRHSAMMAVHVLEAWRCREEMYAQLGMWLDTPFYIIKLRTAF